MAEDLEEKPEGSCIAGEWNGAKAYGEGRGDEGNDITAAGEGGLQGQLHFSFARNHYWIEASE